MLTSPSSAPMPQTANAKSAALFDSAQSLKGIIQHIESLSRTLGIASEDAIKDQQNVQEISNNLVSALDFLPSQINEDVSKIHRLIDEMQNALI